MSWASFFLWWIFYLEDVLFFFNHGGRGGRRWGHGVMRVVKDWRVEGLKDWKIERLKDSKIVLLLLDYITWIVFDYFIFFNRAFNWFIKAEVVYLYTAFKACHPFRIKEYYWVWIGIGNGFKIMNIFFSNLYYWKTDVWKIKSIFYEINSLLKNPDQSLCRKWLYKSNYNKIN